VEIFNFDGLTAVLPARDGGLYLAAGTYVFKFTPHAAEKPKFVTDNYSFIVRGMEFIPGPRGEETLLQIASAHTRYAGLSLTETYNYFKEHNLEPPGPAHVDDARLPEWADPSRPNYDRFRGRWSGYANGRCVYRDAKDRGWFLRRPLFYCGDGGRRRRLCYTGLPGDADHTSRVRAYANVAWRFSVAARIGNSADFLTVGAFDVWGTQPGRTRPYGVEIHAQVFAAEKGKFKADTSVKVADLPSRVSHPAEVYLTYCASFGGGVLAYNVNYLKDAVEVLPDLTGRPPPDWYPDLATAVSPDNPHLVADVRDDRAAWVGLDSAVHVRTASNRATRTFRPNGRRKVRGCAFSADGNTLWAFDSACLFRVDVDD
jgi:hypothetical protein